MNSKGYTLKDLIDIPKMRILLESLDDICSIPLAILDIDGTVLLAIGWQDICINFHRENHHTQEQCQTSDRRIKANLENRKEQVVYSCPMGLTDAAMPVIVRDAHIGNVYVGQFLTKEADEAFFIDQADKFGFDKPQYLTALRKVPILTDEKFRKDLNVLHNITQMFAELGLQAREQRRIEKELREQNLELARSQRLLKESEERFRALHNASFGGIGIHDQGIILDCNQSLADMTGYTHEELVGMNGLKLIAPTSLNQVLANIRSRFSGAYEVEGIRKDGTIYPLAIKGKNIDYFGRKARVIEFRDISEQKNAEAALKQSELKLRNILMNMPVAITLTDETQKITFRNKRFLELFGYDEEDIPTIREWWLRAYPDETFRKEIERLWTKELKKAEKDKVKMGSKEFPILCKDGTTCVVEISAILLERELLTVFVDVTKRKKFEDQLQESESHLRQLIEQSPVGLVLWKIDGTILSVNSAYTRIVGYPETEALKLSYWNCSPEEYGKEERRRLEVLRINEGYGPYEKDSRHKDGRLVPVRVNSMIVDKNDDTIIWSSFEDISVLKNIEQQKSALAEQLKQSQKMEAIGTLAGGIAHDFNNILSAILGYTELSIKNPHCDERIKKNLENVLKAASRARELIKQILTYSRKNEQEREAVLIHEAVIEAIGLLRKTIPATVAIECSINKNTGVILANSTQIHQVVMNLCTNAYHALPEHGGKITVRLQPLEVKEPITFRHQLMGRGTYAQLSITDNGYGIAPDILPLIFDPFFTTKNLGRGTGMGLAVIDGIVQSHNGFIDVISTPRKGSTFNVYFPLTGDIEVPKPKQERCQQRQYGSERILLVDDEPMLINMGKEMLEVMGFRVTTASSATEALDLFLADFTQFDVVVTDQSMPGMSGFELAKQILNRCPDFPVIICSGHSAVLDAEVTRAMGVRTILLKPFSYAKLSEIIRTIFD